ncbi:hypothetical protein EON62_04435 [archaeon]|nr:MAG: hypothetical protein EON62_04435 [archaeon]
MAENQADVPAATDAASVASLRNALPTPGSSRAGGVAHLDADSSSGLRSHPGSPQASPRAAGMTDGGLDVPSRVTLPMLSPSPTALRPRSGSNVSTMSPRVGMLLGSSYGGDAAGSPPRSMLDAFPVATTHTESLAAGGAVEVGAVGRMEASPSAGSDAGNSLFKMPEPEARGPPACDDDITYAFYPGTGAHNCLEANVWNAPVPPLWRERRETRSKNRNPNKAQYGRLAVRRVILERLLPALRSFGPDLIIISAGFDGMCNAAIDNRMVRVPYPCPLCTHARMPALSHCRWRG